jgi:hypothetical protein
MPLITNQLVPHSTDRVYLGTVDEESAGLPAHRRLRSPA